MRSLTKTCFIQQPSSYGGWATATYLSAHIDIVGRSERGSLGLSDYRFTRSPCDWAFLMDMNWHGDGVGM